MALPASTADTNVNTIRLDGTQEATTSTYVLEKDMNGDILTGIGVVNLTNTQIVQLYGTPLTLVGAQGAGKVILVDNAVLTVVTVLTPFTGGGVVKIALGAAAGASVTGNFASAAVVASASTTTITTVIQAAATLTGYANTPLVLTNATAAFAAGGTAGGTLTFKYRVVAAY